MYFVKCCTTPSIRSSIMTKPSEFVDTEMPSTLPLEKSVDSTNTNNQLSGHSDEQHPPDNFAIMAPSFENLPEDDGYDSEEEIDFSGSLVAASRMWVIGLTDSMHRPERTARSATRTGPRCICRH